MMSSSTTTTTTVVMIYVTVAAEMARTASSSRRSIDAAAAAAEAIFNYPMLIAKYRRMATGGVGVRSTSSRTVRVHVHLIADDRTARLRLVEATPLEQTGQWDVNFLVHLEISTENLDLLRVATFATLRRGIVQCFGQFDHNLDIIAGTVRRWIGQGRRICRARRGRRRRRLLLFECVENPCT